MDTKNLNNLIKIYSCEKCDYKTSNKYNFNRHISTAKCSISTKNMSKNVEKFECNKCDYNTVNKFSYNKHLLTVKHNMDTKREKIIDNGEEVYKCNCGKKYKYSQGLSKHKKYCKDNNTDNDNYKNTLKNTILDPISIFEITKQNNELKNEIIHEFKDVIIKEFKELFLQQNKEYNDIINKFMERENQIINTTNNNTTNNNQTNNNQTFNLNFFLNETCKDAMNVKEFLDNLNPTIDDLENVGEKGFVKGISDIIIKSLKEIEVNKRPIHCTDIKREIVYLKEDDKWNKDDKDNSKMKELIRKVENKNFNNIFEWQRNHPDIYVLDSPDYIKQNMLIEKSCEAVDKEDKVRGKVLRELLKEIHINGKQ